MKSREDYANELIQKEERIAAWEHSNNIYGMDHFEDVKVDYWYID